MNTAEIKTLIDTSDGTRLPQYEKAIFSDEELTEYYLNALCEHYDWHDHGDSSPCIAYYYTNYVLGARWHIAEAVIATHPQWALWYAVNVMKSRWPEAEAVIARGGLGDWYNDHFGTDI